MNLNTGFEYRKENLESSDVGNRERINTGVFVHGEIDFPLSNLNIKFVPAVRYDHYSNFGSIYSPKFGILIRYGSIANLSFRANTGKSFRAPTFNDLWWPEDNWTKGNPDLKPETSHNFDCGISYHTLGSLQINLESTYFYRHIKDLILWQPDENFRYSPDNIGKAKIYGLENTIILRLLDYDSFLKITHTYLKAINKTKDSDYYNNSLIYKPEQKITFTTGCIIKSINIFFDYIIVTKQFSDKMNSNSLPQYNLLNSSFSYSFNIHKIKIDCSVKVKNLLNEDYLLMQDYPLPGRELLFSLGVEY
ncbi:MAG: TonB-dependent receptor [bacterium]